MSIWGAARDGDVGEVERLMRQDPGLVNAKHGDEWTPLMSASEEGHMGVVRLLLDEGAAINERDVLERTALWLASRSGRAPVVKLLLERGADPTIVSAGCRQTPLFVAFIHACFKDNPEDHLEVARLLLARPGVRTTINQRHRWGRTVLWNVCYFGGRGVIVRTLLENGADATIANEDGITPMAIAKKRAEDEKGSLEGQECVAALEVSCCLILPSSASALRSPC
jgi:ankyrin repeat protein